MRATCPICRREVVVDYRHDKTKRLKRHNEQAMGEKCKGSYLLAESPSASQSAGQGGD